MAKRNKEEWKIYNNVFDQFTLELLFKLSSQRHFDELLSPIAIGKEANVFLASRADGFCAVKIYRLENCNFNKMYDYIRSDPRFINISKMRRNVIFSWVLREYRNMLKAREVIDVPTVITQKFNILVMEHIGNGAESAPKLKDITLDDPASMYDKIRQMMRLLYRQGFVHADLSEFNILVQDGRPIFIDFSQTTPSNDPNAKEYLTRDCRNIVNFFTKQGLELDEEHLYKFVTS